MKSIYKYIFGCLLTITIISSCKDSGSPLPDTTKGAIPLFTQNADDSGFINFLDLDKTNISFQVAKDGTEAVSSIDIVIVFNNAVTSESDTVIYTTVTSLPGNVALSKSQLLGAFPTKVVTKDTLSIGDSFVITGFVKLSNGTYLDGGFSPSIFSKKPVSLQYNVTCLSAIPLGNYSAVSSGTSTDGCPTNNPVTSYAYDVTLSSTVPGTYKVSDIYAGVYIRWYGACYGYTFETPQSFTDICNSLSISFTGAFSEKVTGTGSYNPVNGKITYMWTNEFGDTGTTVLTPK